MGGSNQPGVVTSPRSSTSPAEASCSTDSWEDMVALIWYSLNFYCNGVGESLSQPSLTIILFRSFYRFAAP